MVVFSKQNLSMDPPFTKLDILCCRNVFIYFELNLQKKLIPLFHFCLNPSGLLFLGSAETIGSFNQLFTVMDGKARLFKREASSSGKQSNYFPANFLNPRNLGGEDSLGLKTGEGFQATVEQLLLLHHTPAAVLANENGDILFINGRTGRYLEPAAGKANWNLFAMAREGLRYPLVTAFQQCLSQKDPLKITNLRAGTENNAPHSGCKPATASRPGPTSGANAACLHSCAAGGGASCGRKAPFRQTDQRPPTRSRSQSQTDTRGAAGGTRANAYLTGGAAFRYRIQALA